MWVQMMEYISGGRPGGDQWPPKGGILEVDDWEGESLIRGQLAVRAVNPNPPVPPLPLPPVAAMTQARPVAEAGKPPAPAVPHHVPPPAPEPVKADPPPVTAPKDAWVAYAVSQGTSPDEARALTKAQLQSVYGGRL